MERSFSSAVDALCVICGAVSGNLEVIDFDMAGAAFDDWQLAVEGEGGGLLDQVAVETTPSGGRHVIYRCADPVAGNMKLAQRRLADGTVGTLIETRGEGGVCLVAPTQGYETVWGDMCDLPVLSGRDRDLLLRCAAELDDAGPPPTDPAPSPARSGLRPGDDYNQRGDVREVLRSHGWRLDRPGDNEHWTRPGKDGGTGATLKDGVFYVFSSNAAPFQPGTPYSRFAVYAMLEHGGNFGAAASALAEKGHGDPSASPPPVPASAPLQPSFAFVGELVRQNSRLRPPLIDGLLRRGETMNVIAAPKTGKSWLTIDLAIAVATGRPWLGSFATAKRSVLILDNELHPETSAHRIPKVAEARGVPMSDLGDKLAVDNLRGRLLDIHAFDRYFAALERGRFGLIVLDAFYRFMPRDTDENDNGAMASVYNAIDRYADDLGCSFVLIHHASKGNQASKSVTDVGAGAGSQSRATDAHLVLRAHEEDGCVVLDAAVRSFPPIEAVGLRWDFPVWSVDDSLDTAMLRRPTSRRTRTAAAADEKPVKPEWTPEAFVEAFVTEEARLKDEILLAASQQNVARSLANSLLKIATERGLVDRRVDGPSAPHRFLRSQPQPLLETVS